MIFTEILKALSERTGARGAVMIDKDGEIVASWTYGGLDMDLVGAHYEIVLDAANEAAGRHGGTVGSIDITTDAARLVILAIKEGYCLVIALERGANPGKIMLEAATAVNEIETEMG